MYRYLAYLILLNLLGGIWLPVLLHAQDPVELVDARTTTQKRYLNPDGSYTARFYSNPVHYLASNGNYHEIDSQIQLSTRLGYDYEVKKGIYQACFKADPTAENSVLISLHTGEKIGFRFVGAGYYDPSTRNYQLFTNTQPAQVSVDDNIITYANMLPGIKMRLRYLGNRLKEDLIITQQARSAMPPPSQFGLSNDSAYAAFIMQIELDSLLRVYRQDGGEIGSFQNGIRVIDFEGFENLLLKRLGREASFFLPLDYAYLENAADSLVSNYYQLKRRIVTHNSKVYVITGVPYTWLTALPAGDVVLDPTFSVSPGAVDDTWLELNSVKGYQPLLIIGKHINYPKKRTLLKFDISSIPGSADIQSADLKVYYYGKHRPSGSTETFINRTVKAHAVLTSWNEYYATVSTPWSTNYGSFGTDYYYDPYASVVFDDETGVWKSFNLTVLASEWHDNTLANNGVLLWATNEDSVGYDLRMYSAEESEYVNYRPYLEVTYTLPLSKFFYVKDHLGSTRAVIDSSGTVKESYDYYPFGLEMPDRIFVQGTVDTRNKFTGKERDGETNWDYFGARYYSGAIGRWTSVDPLADKFPNFSSYNYTLNNPINNFDPNGKEVQFTDSSQAAEYAAGYNNLLGSDDAIGVSTKKKYQKPVTFLGITIREGYHYYALVKNKKSTFNWNTSKVTAAIGDIISNKDVTFKLLETTDFPNDYAEGGFLDSYFVGNGADVYVDPAGDMLSGGIISDSKFIVSLHEMLGHGHPVGDTFYNQYGQFIGADGIQDYFDAYRNPRIGHLGYETTWPSIKWKVFTKFPGVNYK